MLIMTYNIRYSNDIDGIHCWDNRKKLLVKTINEINPDILSLQEAMPDQLSYLDANFPEYLRVGEGRFKNNKPDEHCPIYFKKNIFELTKTNTVWYSETPEIRGSIGWDASLPRIFTYAELKDKEKKTKLAVINTHLEHKGKKARLESVNMLRKFAESYSQIPLVITGDFNMTEDFEGYSCLVDDGSLKDARYISKTKFKGPIISTNFFGTFEHKKAIDFVFVNRNFTVKTHETIVNDKDGIYPSDHYPIFCEIEPANQ